MVFSFVVVKLPTLSPADFNKKSKPVQLTPHSSGHTHIHATTIAPLPQEKTPDSTPRTNVVVSFWCLSVLW